MTFSKLAGDNAICNEIHFLDVDQYFYILKTFYSKFYNIFVYTHLNTLTYQLFWPYFM